MANIEVRINVGDIPKGRTLDYGVWETWLVGKFREAGIPMDENGDLTSGMMIRRDDPDDFAVTIYTLVPDGTAPQSEPR